MDNIKIDVFNKYLQIKQDIVNNIPTVFNRKNTYIRKYRGNILTDINVGFYSLDDNYHVIQIFIRHQNEWINDKMIFNKGNKLIHSDIKTTLNKYD